MAMTPYSGDTSVIGQLGTTPQERGLTTQQFKDKFDEGLKAFVEWFNLTHKTEFEALGQAMGKIKIIEFGPYSGTIDLDTLTEPCLYKFAGSVSVINGPYEIMGDQTMLVTGGAMSFQITIKDGEIAYRNSSWNGIFGSWYKITRQVRNIILSPDEADAELMGNGDIWIQYEEGEE
jgi:hypothetical protein